MKRYLALCHIDRGTEKYNAGEHVPLPDETAARLLAMDPPAIAELAVAATSAETPKLQKPARLTAEKMIERIKAAPDLTALLQLQEEEHDHADGPRKTVVAAIEARFDALGETEEDGQADSASGEGAAS